MTPAVPLPSMPTWETLEDFLRSQIQTTMQAVLEEEMTALLGRGKSERRAGVGASPGSIERLRSQWQADYDAWCTRELNDRELVYVWADGVYVKAGLEREKAALLVIIGAMADGTKEVLAVTPGYRESTESWKTVFADLKQRGLDAPKLMGADGAAGAWAAASAGWPEGHEQRCWK